MSLAIGMLELNSIACGMETCDVMIKAADIELIHAAPTCPGKYIILVGGDTGAVNEALSQGTRCAAAHEVGKLILPRVHPAVLDAIRGRVSHDSIRSLGIIEFRTVSSAVIAADFMVKAANISLIRVSIGHAIGGKGYVVVTGDVGDVNTSVDAAEKGLREKPVYVTVIAQPSGELLRFL